MANQIDLGQALNFQGQSAKEAYPNISTLISNILPNVYILAGLILLFGIIFGGFTMISNAGNKEKQQQGKEVITKSLLGFAIIFASYWIIQIIQILTGINILNPNL